MSKMSHMHNSEANPHNVEEEEEEDLNGSFLRNMKKSEVY